MASATSGRSSHGSASSARVAGDEGVAWSPVSYRERHEPAVYCYCRKKAPRWISWSILNPGRRYYACMKRLAGGCNFWLWYDNDDTTAFVKQLPIDLRDKVWDLTKENARLRDSVSETRAHVDQMSVQRAHLEHMLLQGAEATNWRKIIAEKDAQLAGQEI